jgi:hypothetical protein
MRRHFSGYGTPQVHGATPRQGGLLAQVGFFEDLYA